MGILGVISSVVYICGIFFVHEAQIDEKYKEA